MVYDSIGNPACGVHHMDSKLITWKMGLAAIAVFAVATIVPGCLGDFVQVKTPTGAVDSGVPSTLPYNDSIPEYEEYLTSQQLIIDSWSARIGAAEEKIAFWNSAIGALTTPESLALFGLNPVGGASMAAVFLGGLLIKRPRDVTPTQHAQGKNDSFNKGQEIAKKIVDNRPAA